MKKPKRYKRCARCRELVNDPDNCAVCANRNPLSLNIRDERKDPIHGFDNRRKPNLDGDL